MKRLLLALAFLALTLTAQAQTTNVFYVLTIEEATTRTNSFTNILSARQVEGLNINWTKDVQSVVQSNAVLLAQNPNAVTNATPSFRNSARNNIADLFKPFAQQAEADERQRFKADTLQNVIGSIWPLMTSQERQDYRVMSSNLVTKYVP